MHSCCSIQDALPRPPQDCFKLLGGMLRQCERWQPGTSQLRFLVTWAFSDLEESAGRQNAFHLLKASWQCTGAGAGIAAPLLHVGQLRRQLARWRSGGAASAFCIAALPSYAPSQMTTATIAITLQAILSRKLVLPEVYDLMNRVQARGSGVLGSCTRLHEADAGVLHPAGLPAFTLRTRWLPPPLPASVCACPALCTPACMPALPSGLIV